MPGTELFVPGTRPDEDAPAAPPRAATIEPNGSEYLVTINGAVFVTLSLAEAEAFAERMRSAHR